MLPSDDAPAEDKLNLGRTADKVDLECNIWLSRSLPKGLSVQDRHRLSATGRRMEYGEAFLQTSMHPRNAPGRTRIGFIGIILHVITKQVSYQKLGNGPPFSATPTTDGKDWPESYFQAPESSFHHCAGSSTPSSDKDFSRLSHRCLSRRRWVNGSE